MIDLAPEKDRIVILGRPSAGKSVYLAVLYQQLWDSPDTMTIRAADGMTHTALMNAYAQLLEGNWLPSTQAIGRYDLELIDRDRVIPLSMLDYPGELYRQMFYEKRMDRPELEALYEYVNRAMGVILLIDPRDVVQAGEAHLDTEYAAIQVIEHYRATSNGAALPIVIVFTKRDENNELIQQAGGLSAFARAHMPRLYRLLKGVPVVHLSAVRTIEAEDKRRVPWMASSGEQVAIPLRLIIKQIEKADRERRAAAVRPLHRWWKRRWWPVFFVVTAVWLFLTFFALGVWIAS